MAASAATLLAVVVGFLFFGASEERPVAAVVIQAEQAAPPIASQQPPPEAAPPIASQQPPPEAAPQMAPDIAAQPDSLIASCNAVLSQWDRPLLNDDVSSSGFDFDREFKARGFKLVRLAGRFDELNKFNVPLLMPLPEDQGGGYLAVLGQTAPDLWSISPTYQGREALTSSELNNLGMRMALLPWVDFASIGYVAIPGVQGDNVRRLQFLLGSTGYPDVPTSGRYDGLTVESVKSFQRNHGLIVDGLVGPRTLIRLYHEAGAYKMPRLS